MYNIQPINADTVVDRIDKFGALNSIERANIHVLC